MIRKRIWSLTICIVLILAGGLAYRYTTQNIFFKGTVIPRNAMQMDLRGKDMTPDEFDELQAKIPDCRILWSVPFQGKAVSSNIASLRVDTLSDEDLALLDYFPDLTLLEAPECTDYAQLEAYRISHPECTVEFRVELGGTAYDREISILRLKDPDIQELHEKLPYLPNMMWLRLSGTLPDVAQLEQLRAAFPHINIQWQVPFRDRMLSTAEPILDLSNQVMDYTTALELLRWFPDATRVDMRGCGLTDEEMMDLADTYPDCLLVWNMTVGKFQFPTDAAELDISGYVMQSTQQIESLLPYFPNLKKVIMSHCGFDDVTMDALNNRYPDIRFVWSVKIKDVYLRTDATYFFPFKFYRHMTVNNKDLYPLRYCTDIVCIDIGHMGEVTDCEWAAFMPNLTYLILVETSITDLTPLSGLKNLVFLEIFKTRITDYSPLLGCTGLEDLNMSMTYGDYRPIAQMTWLKNLWWNGVARTHGLPCSGAVPVLEKALPNTRFVYNQANSAYYTGWRDLPNYFAMRDCMDMFYLR